MSRQRWWGWGQDGHDGPVPAGLLKLLREEAGLEQGAPRRAVPDPQDVVLPEATLGAAARVALRAVVGPEHVREDHRARLDHAAGRSYPDLLALRAGAPPCAPDAVVLPADADQVLQVVLACAEHDVAVVPFGGGSSVVGGVAALRGTHHAAIALDLERLAGVLELSPRAGLARVAAGTYGPDLEAALAERGLTLGHLPQSFEFSTVGGWAATRSAGQASSGYGRSDELIQGLSVATPSGVIATSAVPGTAAGPDLRQLLIGSEGTLGVVTEATLRVRPVPAVQRFEAYSLPGFAEATEALRDLAQAGLLPAVTRLSDEEESAVNLALAGGAGTAVRGALRLRGQRRPCVLVLGHEATGTRTLGHARRAVGRVLRGHHGVRLGRRPGDAWAKGRFHGPYLRDELMGLGVLVDTLETAATWDDLLDAYRAVGSALRAALAARGTPGVVGCHVSHVYPTGASLYFTFLARQDPTDPLGQWQAVKAAASDAIRGAGATITHHHAVGRDHAPWLQDEVGPLGIAALQAVKAAWDPTGVMNPGKLADPAALEGPPGSVPLSAAASRG